MSTFLERIRKEKDELEDKLEKLENFIANNSLFSNLSDCEQKLMVIQLNTMMMYRYVLGERITLNKLN